MRLAAIKAGQPEVETPVYSHRPTTSCRVECQVIRQPELVIVEGLNVLQVNTKNASPDRSVVSDFFDFSIYVDAAEEDVARWFDGTAPGSAGNGLAGPGFVLPSVSRRCPTSR